MTLQPWAPLGDVLNQLTTVTSGYDEDDPFSRTFAVITTADQFDSFSQYVENNKRRNTADEITNAFTSVGFDWVNFDLMPGVYLEFGTKLHADTFFMLAR